MDKEMIMNSFVDCFQKNKELMPFSQIFSDSLSTFVTKFSEYQLEPDYENFCNLLSNLKVDVDNKMTSPAVYNKEGNTLIINSDMIKKMENKGSRIFNSIILTMFTYVYNIETDKFNLGLTFEENNQLHGEYINTQIDERIKELFFGNEEVFHKEDDVMIETITLPTASDQIASDMQELIGAENLFRYYLNGRGDLFIAKMSNLFNSEEECIRFIDSMEKLKENNPQQDDEYYVKIENLLEKADSLKRGNTL